MKKILIALAFLGLAACQAEDVEVKLTGQDVVDAANGEVVSVKFEAEVGERYTTIDDEKRETITKVVQKIKNYFPDADIEVDFSGDGYAIEIEGEFLLSSTQPKDGPPWYISAQKHPFEDFIKISLATSGNFPAFQAALKEVNFMLSPDEFQPVEFKFKAESGIVILSGAEIAGIPTGIDTFDMDSSRLNISFGDGIWKEAPASFLCRP